MTKAIDMRVRPFIRFYEITQWNGAGNYSQQRPVQPSECSRNVHQRFSFIVQNAKHYHNERTNSRCA